MAKGRLLAIDDEKFFREFYRDLLCGEGYDVRVAAGGEEALDILRAENGFDLVITDMEMPGMNGVETTEAIKRLYPEQEVIVVTAQHDVTLAVEAMKRGVADYILKPVNAEEFLLVINRVLFRQALHVERTKLFSENLEFLSILLAYRKCLVFLKVNDPDRLGDLILDTLMELLKAEGAVLWMAEDGGRQYRFQSCRGRSVPPAGDEVFRPNEVERRLIHGGKAVTMDRGAALWLPLLAGVEPLAFIRVERPGQRPDFSREDQAVADAVGEFAASALHGSLQRRRFDRQCFRVRPGGGYTMAFFTDTLERELRRCDRYGRNLSLIKLVVVNYREVACRFLDRELGEVVNRMADTLQSVLRDADILAMESPDQYFILLPETDYWGALVAQKRIRKALAGQLCVVGPKKQVDLDVFMRSASFPVDGATFASLRATVEKNIAQLPDSLFLRAGMESLSFWDIVDGLLTKKGGSPSLFGETEAASSVDALAQSNPFYLDSGRMNALMEAFCREVVESNRVRGIVYRGCADFDAVRQALGQVDGLEQSATSLFFLGGTDRVHWDYQRIHPIYIDDPRFSQVDFLLYLNEDHAYALFTRQVEGELAGFHSCDFFFVENLIAKLQEQYRLQALI
ncbi:response regulator [Desulfuromonas sp. KJ2020]|uniref:response regulator n=1 Tax=Desulfuromonas sp. KJ2020 TaxID=2919173 RepID=UPI0020A7A824|nr:response regulator [Desulfuromonas sp. KJ2020]MCP3177472.1 response regulator [Desulfuromonas sp. KJ2020]